MLTEVLKIIPKLDDKDLSTMEKTLSSRFSKIAKGFGSALKTTLLGAVGTALLAKLLSPLKEVREAIDKTLQTANDVATNSAQFGTTAESLLKLHALGGLKGLEPGQLDLLLTKFQGATAQAKINPNDENVSSVRNFANRPDTAMAFLDFIRSLQTLPKTQQLLVQQQVFGEKQVLKMSEFLNSDFTQSLKELQGVDFHGAAVAVGKLDQLQSLKNRNQTINGINDLRNKGNVINSGTISSINDTEIGNLKRENMRISGFQNAVKVEEAINKINDNIETLVQEALTQMPIILTGLQGCVDLLKESVKGWKMLIELIKGSSWFKGVKGLFGYGKDE